MHDCLEYADTGILDSIFVNSHKILWINIRQIFKFNTRFTAPLMRRGKTKLATVKWYNLCLQIIQSQTSYPLNLGTFDMICIYFYCQLMNLIFLDWSAADIDDAFIHRKLMEQLKVLMDHCYSKVKRWNSKYFSHIPLLLLSVHQNIYSYHPNYNPHCSYHVDCTCFVEPEC